MNVPFKIFVAASKDVQIMVKLQIIQSNEEVHSLSQDMARLMNKDDAKDTVLSCTSNEDEPVIKAHSWIIKCRSTKLANRLMINNEDEKHKVSYCMLQRYERNNNTAHCVYWQPFKLSVL